jgi:hypothetical protein
MPNGDAGLNNILQAAVSLGQQLEIFGIPYCVIGGVAVQRWGEPVIQPSTKHLRLSTKH